MRKTNAPTLKCTNGTEVDVYVSYHDGKDSRNPTKGYSLHIQPVKRERDGQFVITTASGYTGRRGLIEQAARFNQKRLDELAANAPTTELYAEGLAQVLLQNNLTIETA